MIPKRYALPLLFAPFGASALDITVTRLDDPLPDGCSVADCSLREAVLFANGAVGPDRILLPASASPYQLTRSGSNEEAGLTGDLDVTGALELAGQGATPVVVAQTTSDRLLHLQGIGAPTVIRNVHLQGGRGVQQGGAVLAAGAPMQVFDSEFSGNSATNGGGAIGALCPDGFLSTVFTIAGSRFEDNGARDGAAVSLLPTITGSCSLQIDGSDFIDNEATRLGGAVAVDGSLTSARLDIRECVFTGNRVVGDIASGGAVGMGPPASNNFSIADSTFLDNRAVGATSSSGGAVLHARSIVRSLFLANVANRGGAVYSFTVDIEESTFCDNQAAIDGGAAWTILSNVRRSMFCRNTAAGQGGALMFSGNPGNERTIQRSTFDANMAPSGGAIAADDGIVRLFQSTFASVDVPAPGSVGTVLRYAGPQDAANGRFVELTGNLLRGTCSFANGVGTVRFAKHNANSGGNTCGLTQAGANYANNVTFATLGGIPLAGLANNGGPTLTRLPSPAAGHPAVGRVPLADCVDPDQRYLATTNSSCDAGAVELDGAPRPDALFANGFEG